MENLQKSPSSPKKMLPQKWNSNLKNKFLILIQERDRKESKGFAELFQHHEKLFENWASIRAENLRLSMQVERGFTDRPGTGQHSEEREKALEQKVLALQEELTELHRKRGENASQVLTLSAKLTEREAELDINRTSAATAVAKAADLEDQVKFLQSKLQELEGTFELLRDEHQALHLAYSSLEDKHRKLNLENQDLLKRFFEVKEQHATLMNQENENFVKKRQLAVQKALEDAAAEIKVSNLPEPSPPKGGYTNINPSMAQLSSVSVTCTIPNKPTIKFDAHENDINCVKWSPNGRHIATAGLDRKIKIWEAGITGANLVSTLTGSNKSILCLDFDSSGSRILASSSDWGCRIWTVDDGRPRHTLTGHCDEVWAARFMSDSTRCVSGSKDRTLKIWDLRKSLCIATNFAGSACKDLVTLSDEHSIISGHHDKRIRFWDTRSTTPIRDYCLSERITSLDLSTNQDYLLASIRDNTIQVFDLRINSVIGEYSAEGFKISSDYTRASFSPDGQYIACGSADGSIFVWNVMENKLETVLKDHTCPVIAVHWHPKGISLLSGDVKRKVIIWT